ncbi:MAG: hypothetical protein Q8L72_01885 [Moraxellaceae bacterium]|nr:hypothetical protein [Moraxellaceae bacterium]
MSSTTTTPLRRKTIIGWLLTTTFFIGLVAYEWLPMHLRGAWVFFIALIMAGAFLKVSSAIALGLIAFLTAALHFYYKLSSGVYIEHLILLLFISPLAPIGLSAIRHNLNLRTNASNSLLIFKHKIEREIIPVQLLETFIKSQLHLLNRSDIAACHSKIIGIEISLQNIEEIKELLGTTEWTETRSKVLLMIESYICNGFHAFGDESLEKITLINIDDGSSNYSDQITKKLNEISILQTNIRRVIYEPSRT